MTSTPINEDSVTLECLCDWKRWNSKSSEIKLNNPYIDKLGFSLELCKMLYAKVSEPPEDTELIPLTMRDMPWIISLSKRNDSYKDFWRSGGYDLGTILFWIYVKLEQNKIADSLFYKRVHEEGYIRIEDSYSVGRFLDILKYCEITFDLLIRKKITTFSEANSIIKNSREVGGTSIAGYNTLILTVGILDILVNNKYISQNDGQRILEAAKLNLWDQ